VVKIGILTTLIALVLFGLTFSSCKKCNKESKPADGNDKVSDTKTSGSATDSGEDLSSATDSGKTPGSATGSGSQPKPAPAPVLTPQQLEYMAKAKAARIRAEAVLANVRAARTSDGAVDEAKNAFHMIDDTKNARKDAVKAALAAGTKEGYDDALGAVNAEVQAYGQIREKSAAEPAWAAREPLARLREAQALAEGAIMMATAAKNAGTNEMREYATKKARELAADARATGAKVKDDRVAVGAEWLRRICFEKDISTSMENELVANGL
jgi:hypothetical protein